MGGRMSEKKIIVFSDGQQVIDNNLNPVSEPPKTEFKNARVTSVVLVGPILIKQKVIWTFFYIDHLL